MTKTTETKTTRRPYRKPQLEQVQLAIEEAVLQGCKAEKVGPGPLAEFGANCEASSNQCLWIQT